MLRHVEGPEQDWFSKKELAAYLDLSEKTIDRLIVAGSFPRGIRSTIRGNPRWSWIDVVMWMHLCSRCNAGPVDQDPPDPDDDIPAVT